MRPYRKYQQQRGHGKARVVPWTRRHAFENEQGSTELTEVTLQDNELTFTLARQTQRGSFESVYSGEVDSDSLA